MNDFTVHLKYLAMNLNYYFTAYEGLRQTVIFSIHLEFFQTCG